MKHSYCVPVMAYLEVDGESNEERLDNLWKILRTIGLYKAAFNNENPAGRAFAISFAFCGVHDAGPVSEDEGPTEENEVQ